jgi:hypothetical protein
MSPSAETAAARRSGRRAGSARNASTKPGRARSTPPRSVRRTVAPRVARRVSGPLRGRAAAALRPAPAPLGPRLVAFASALPDRSLVDRLVRGRWWIAVVGTLLIGLVAMQVSLLKLNAGIGRAVERSAALERANGELRAQVSRLQSGEGIQERAAALGMVMPPPGQISYLRAQGPRDAAAAALALGQQRFNDPAKALALPGDAAAGDPWAAVPTAEDQQQADEQGGAAAGEEGDAAAEEGTAAEEEGAGDEQAADEEGAAAPEDGSESSGEE